jgi:hypothetical protein
LNARTKRHIRFFTYTATALASLLLVLFVSIAFTLFWAYQNPLPAFKYIESRFLPSDLEIKWSRIDFDGRSLGGLDFTIDITLNELHISKQSPNLDLPIEKTRVRASFFPLRRKMKIELVEVFASAPIRFRASVSDKGSRAKNPFEQIQSVLKVFAMIRDRVPIEQVNAKIDQFIFKPLDGEALTMSIGLKKPMRQPLDVVFALNMSNESRTKVSAVASLDFELMKTSVPFLHVSLRFKGAGIKTTQKIELAANDAGISISSMGTIIYKRKKLTITSEPKLTARFSENKAEMTLVGGVRGLQGPILEFDNIRIVLKTPLESGTALSEKPSKFNLSMPVKLFFVSKKNRALVEKACACKLPEVLQAKAEGNIWLSTLLGRESESKPKLAFDSEIEVETIENKIVALDLKGGLNFEIHRQPKQTKYIFLPRLNLTAKIRSFQNLKVLLDANGILIPAPLDVMDGSLEFRAKGPIASDNTGSRFPLALAINLASAGQKVEVNTDGTVQVNALFNQAHLDVNAKISNLIIDLPPLNPLDGLPRIANDSRFIKEPAKMSVKPKFKFSLNFQIETRGENAIQLKSPYFNPHLPMSIKIQAGVGEENSGFVSIQPFDITYLRRTVHVENLKMNFDGDDKAPLPIKGRFSVKQTDYLVFIDVEGTTKSPIVKFSSDPYLPKEEIISVLLYDRTSDQLLPGDAETKGSVQAAIADRAIGLFGLWAFASTPIKSFSYNPVTKVYTATIAVSDDVTAGIGTSWESAAHLELRKRISKRWSLTAAWTPASQEESAVSKIVLQWERRF